MTNPGNQAADSTRRHATRAGSRRLSVAKYVADSEWRSEHPAPRIAPESVPDCHVLITLARDNLPPSGFCWRAAIHRDLLDTPVDLLLTREPAALDYAARWFNFSRAITVAANPRASRARTLPLIAVPVRACEAAADDDPFEERREGLRARSGG